MDVSKEKLPEMNISQDMQTAQPIVSQVQAAVAKKASDNVATGLEPAVSDQAHLSGAASLASQAASVPDVRQEKVAVVQVAIADGTYNVKSSDVAQSLMDQMLGEKA
jgi:negative regulator of flagellin synthesis FlgM